MGEGWLDARLTKCQNCGESLFLVNHSPMDDSLLFYCTECPKRVEVSRYDEIAVRITRRTSKRGKLNEPEYVRQIEEKLAPCDCGGTFKLRAERRCLYCRAIILQANVGTDVWYPETANPDLSGAEMERSAARHEALMRRQNIWKRS
jgi:hypothetical protein